MGNLKRPLLVGKWLFSISVAPNSSIQTGPWHMMIGTPRNAGSAAALSTLHPDIVETHILAGLDFPARALAASTCSQPYALYTQEDLWANLCCCSWPSPASPRVRHVIMRSFPHCSRSFFLDSCSTSSPFAAATLGNGPSTPELISAVDLYYGQQLVLSKVVEIETASDGFRSSPFRVDMMLDDNVVQIPCLEALEQRLRLSWIVIDGSGGRAMTVSSQKPIRVQWDTDRLEVKFASAMVGQKWELALCSVTVRCVRVEDGGGKMEVREGSLQVEDLDGKNMNGRECLVIIQRALEGERERIRGPQKGYDMFKISKAWRRQRVILTSRAAIAGLLSLCVCLMWPWCTGTIDSLRLVCFLIFLLCLFGPEIMVQPYYSLWRS